ncbi:class I SAM-dependent methyltransferase [Devosia sp. CAU 1758]
MTDIEASRTYWNGRAVDFDDHFDVLPVRRQTVRRVGELARVAPGAVVLDLGTGTARVLRERAEKFAMAAQLIGLDFSAEMLARAKMHTSACRLHRFKALAGSFLDIPLPSGSVDCVLSSLALHHVSDADKQRVAREIIRVLKPGGQFVIADQMNCTGRELDAVELKEMMIRTFFPHVDPQEARSRTSSQAEYTCALGFLADLFDDMGATVQSESVCDLIGIVHGSRGTA